MDLNAADVQRMQRILRHRLLNIVSGVKSATSMLASQLDERLNPREREYFPLILQECDQVSVVVNRMEELFAPLPAQSPAALADALPPIMEKLRIQYPMAEIGLDLSVTDGGKTICSDVLERALVEMVGNAVEITRRPVRVRVNDSGSDAYAIDVMDQGDVVEEEVREMAFEPFYTGRTRHIGIGLALVKRRVEGCGGQVLFESGPAGNRVGFVLPCLAG